MGGSQARQSMKQLTGAGKRGQGEEKGEPGVCNTWGSTVTPQGAE